MTEQELHVCHGSVFRGMYGLKSRSNPKDTGTTLVSRLSANRLGILVVILYRGELF
jgi:hypothetical protein